MATRLDLGEQEQLDALKDFWKQYGNLITWALVLVLGGIAAFQGWQRYQADRGAKASVLFEELDKAVIAGDVERTARVFADMKERYPSTTFAGQAGLLAAKLQFDQGQAEASRVSLEWVASNAGDAEYRVIAKLRLAGLLLDAKLFDAALAQLPIDAPKAFEALVADRRGDILQAQGKLDEARAAYRVAYDAMAPTLDYRRVVDAKLTALGGATATPAGTLAAGASQ